MIFCSVLRFRDFFFGLSSRVEQFEKAGRRRRPENVIASTITSWSKTSRASSVKFNYLGQDPASRSRYHYGYTSSYTVLDLSMASRRIPQHDRRSQQVGWGGGGPARGTSGDEGGTHEDGKRHRLPTHLPTSFLSRLHPQSSVLNYILGHHHFIFSPENYTYTTMASNDQIHINLDNDTANFRDQHSALALTQKSRPKIPSRAYTWVAKYWSVRKI